MFISGNKHIVLIPNIFRWLGKVKKKVTNFSIKLVLWEPPKAFQLNIKNDISINNTRYMIPNKRTFFFIITILKINNYIFTKQTIKKYIQLFITSLDEH